VTVRWTLRALTRLAEIRAFVERDDPAAAARLLDRILNRAEALARFPRQGRRMPEFPRVREVIVGRYRVVYRIRKDVEVLTVFEAHRLPPASDIEE
jgi:plasmid stabilization system protein ParE